MKRLVVYHSNYGCETGCCGHSLEFYDNNELIDDQFVFSHVYSSDPTRAEWLEWAKRQAISLWGSDHLSDIDWDHGIVVDISAVSNN